MKFLRSWRYLYSSERYISTAPHLRAMLKIPGQQAIDLEEREWVMVVAPMLAQIPEESDDESESNADSAADSGGGVWL